MYQRLIKFIDANEILSKHQYGFRKNRSTEHAIIEITDKISKAIDEGKYTIGIFLDLSKSFDTVNHEILIKKLEHYGIRGLCIEWFKSYLKERKQIVNFLINDISFLSLLFQRTYVYNKHSRTICIKTFYLKLKIFTKK